MTGIRAFFIAFSIYSKLPVPQFPWRERDMQYVLCFLPFVGLGITGLLWGFSRGAAALALGSLPSCLITAAIPLFFTGGFHLDGYLDTSDALSSYREREEKLRILKDSHIGAFSVICLARFGLLYLAAISCLWGTDAFLPFTLSFVLSRILAAFTVLYFPKAKKEGSLHYFSEGASRMVVTAALSLMLLLVCLSLWAMTALLPLLLSAGLSLFLYYRLSMREFGGVTGDTAGWFICVSELMMALALCVPVLWPK